MFEGTRWFSLSARELRVLLVAAAFVMLALVFVRLARSILWQGDIEVVGLQETLPHAPLLDVNTARDYELMLVPGIGEKTARAIVDYRAQHGPFGRLEDLANVPGIGDKTVERLRKHLTCIPPARERR
jgi:competence ComEA-like helix-hairpin-helix protein